MKCSLFAIIAIFFFTEGTIFLRAQTPAPAPAPSAPASHENGMISFLTPDQQQQYAKAHAKALADNPDLKVEGENLMKQVMASGGNPDSAIIEKMDTHRQKLRQAMLKEDPTLTPIFAEIDKRISQAKAKQLGQLQNSSPKSTPSSQ